MRVGVWIVLGLIAGGVWLASTGRIERAITALRILDDLRRPGGASWLRRGTPAPIRTAIALAGGGRRYAADLYRPARGGGRVPLLLIPGLVEAGKDDPRVPPFAELLARAGFVVVVPDLPSFRTLRVHPDNRRELLEALEAVAARPDLAPAGRAGLFGISYGGGIAMLAAVDPARAARIPFVATVGAYADLDTVLRFLATGRTTLGGRARRVEPDPYGRLVLLRTHEEFLEAPRDRALLEAMVARRIRDPGAAIADLADSLSPPARVLYDLFETAAPDEVPALAARLPEGLRRRVAELSPGRQDFTPLRARLYLVHDAADGTFPAGESLRLAARAGPRRARVLVLEALRHVVPEPWSRDPWGFVSRDLPEAARLLAWWYHLLAERGAPRPADPGGAA